MANIGNTTDVKLGSNTGNVGSKNTFGIQGKSECVYSFLLGCHDSFITSLSRVTLTGGVGPNASVGNTTGVTVTGSNAGNIGSGNTFDIKGEIFTLID